MKVKDLIKELQELDPEAELWGFSKNMGEAYPINENPFYFDFIDYNKEHQFWHRSDDDGESISVLIIDTP